MNLTNIGDLLAHRAEHKSAEAKLIAYVIAQVIYDLGHKKQYIRNDAERYINLKNADLLHLCQLIGLCPRIVMYAADKYRDHLAMMAEIESGEIQQAA